MDEVPEELGVAFFQWYRDASLWGLTDPRHRAELFRIPRRDIVVPVVPERLHRAATTFRSLVVDPVTVSAQELAAACAVIAEWANSLGYAKTELAFARAAARANDMSTDHAFRAGRAARRNARYEEAQEWFRRAVALARRADDDAAYASAYLGWGVLEQMRGNNDRARRRFVKAWKRVKGGRLPKLAAAARHYMIPLSLGNLGEGIRHAVAAYKLYGSEDHRLAALASDTGAFLCDHHHYAAAKPLFEAALRHVGGSPDRIVPLSNLARAVAALGDREGFIRLWREANQRGSGYRETHADALIELAEGARTLREFRYADASLREAIAVATERREPGPLQRAEAVLAELHSKPPDTNIPAPPEVSRFVRRFVRRLNKQQAAPGA